MQLSKFRRIFEHAKQHSVFYRDLYKQNGVFDLKIEKWEDIQKVPVIDKYIMRKHDYSEILTRPINEKLNLHTTSGSTGEPFRVFQNKYEDYTSHVRVFELLKRIGYNPTRKICLITRYESNDKFMVEKDLSLISKIQKTLGLFQREIISIYEDPETIIEKVEKSKPYILWSTPSILEMIANTLIASGKTLNIPWVVLTSETILPHQYPKFYQSISKNVVGHYGLIEAPTISYNYNNSDERKVFANTFLMEYTNIREDEGLMLGTPVVTNLVNQTMPFIRYNTHDTGSVLSDGDFPQKIMGTIIGRIDDVLEFPDGSKFAHHHAHEMFMDFEECEQFKFIQKRSETIRLLLKPNKKYSKDEIKTKALERWKKRFSSFPIIIEFVENFAINPKTGKFKNIEKMN